MCDATKYGQVATWLALPLAEFNQIVTDDGLPESAIRALAKVDISLLMAKNSGAAQAAYVIILRTSCVNCSRSSALSRPKIHRQRDPPVVSRRRATFGPER